MKNQKLAPNVKRRVFFVNEDGDNSNDGLTPETAKRTIASVEEITCPGDIIYVGPQSSGIPPHLSGKITASGSITNA